MKCQNDPLSTPLSTPLSNPLSNSLSKGISSGKFAETTEGQNYNITRVRAGLTDSPQLSLGDFRIHSTPYGMEVYFSQRRIREPLRAAKLASRGTDAIASQSTAFSGKLLREINIAMLTVVCTIIFVGGAVALTGSILLGVLVAALLPLGLAQVSRSERPQGSGQAVLRLSGMPTGRTLLTLKTVSLSRGDVSRGARGHRGGSYGGKRVVVNSMVQGANLPVILIRSSPQRLSKLLQGRRAAYELSFIFEPGSQLRGHRQLHISGSRQEILWLCNHLSTRTNVMPQQRGV